MPQTSNLVSQTLVTVIHKRYQCRRVHADGRQCGSPALRSEAFCYHHHTTRHPKNVCRGFSGTISNKGKLPMNHGQARGIIQHPSRFTLSLKSCVSSILAATLVESRGYGKWCSVNG
jgi:hypothetical protein